MLKILLANIFLFFSLFSFSQTWKELNDTVRYYMERGEFENSIIYGHKVLSEVKEEFGENHKFYAGSLNNLGSMYKNLGIFAKAEPLLLASLEIRKKLGDDTNGDYALALSNIASLYTDMGQYEKAESLYIAASAIWKKTLGAEHPDYATSLSNLSSLYLSMGQISKASPLIKEATEIRKKVLGDKHPAFGRSLVSVANILAWQGDYKIAEIVFSRAASILKTALGTSHLDYINCLKGQAALYELSGEFNKAESLFLEVMRVEQGLYKEAHPSYASSLRNLAELYLKMGQPAKAEPLLLANSKVVLKHLQNNFIAFSAVEKQNYLANTISLLETNNSYLFNFSNASNAVLQNNFHQHLVFKSMILEDSRSLFRSAQKSNDTIVQNLLKDWRSNKQLLARQYSLPPADRRQDIPTLEADTENLEKMLGRRSAEFRKQQNAYSISATDIQNQLQPGEVAIEFVRFKLYNKKWTDSTLYAAYILRHQDPAPIFIPLCEELQLGKIFDSAGKDATAMVSKLYRGMEGKSKENAGALGADLYNLIWKPLEPHLKGIKTIHYSPAGKLYNLALHALPVDSNTLLMDKYNLHQYTNIKNIASRDSDVLRIKDAVLFGDPVFSLDSLELIKQKQNSTKPKLVLSSAAPLTESRGDSLWSQLEGTAVEIKKLNELFTASKIDTRSYLRLSASEEQLKKLDGHGPRVLHIATHGFFLPKHGKKTKESRPIENTYTIAEDPLLRSGLVLTGGNYAWSGKAPVEGVEDGIVTAYEISQLDLSGTEIVVLSACETALGDIKGTEGVFGLQRAFKLAGVNKMIVSLWEVPDKETVLIMTSFYQHLIKGRSVNEAFLLAQTEMRKKYPALYWAAFVLVQ